HWGHPIVAVIGLLIAWALYRPLGATVGRLAHDFRHLSHAHVKLSGQAIFTLCFIVLIIGALITSADWPEIEQIVPRTACWAALIVACLNLITEIFGADEAPVTVAGHGHAAAEKDDLPAGVTIRRAVEFFGWLIGLVALA